MGPVDTEGLVTSTSSGVLLVDAWLNDLVGVLQSLKAWLLLLVHW